MRSLILLALVGLRRPAGRRRPRHGVRRHVDHAPAGHRHQPGRRRRPRSTSARSAPRWCRASRTGGSGTSTGRSSCASASPARSARSSARTSCRTSRRTWPSRSCPRSCWPSASTSWSGSRSSGCARTASGSRCASGSSRPLGLFAGLRRRDRRRRLGTRRHPRAPGVGSHRAAQGHRLDRHVRVPRRHRRQPRLPDRPRLAGHQPRLGPRAPRRRRHRRPDRRVARPQDPRPHPRLRGRWPDRAHQRPHPPAQRLGRPGRHLGRGLILGAIALDLGRAPSPGPCGRTASSWRRRPQAQPDAIDGGRGARAGAARRATS